MMNFYRYYNHRVDLDNYHKYDELIHHVIWNAFHKCDMSPVEHIIMKSSRHAFQYVTHVIKGRWEKCEPYIMKDPHAAVNYCRFIFADRWIEAEPYIMTCPFSAGKYANTILGGRWLEAENVIMTDPQAAVMYAYLVIKGRWLEAEQYIQKQSYWWGQYKRQHNISDYE